MPCCRGLDMTWRRALRTRTSLLTRFPGGLNHKRVLTERKLTSAHTCTLGRISSVAETHGRRTRGHWAERWRTASVKTTARMQSLFEEGRPLCRQQGRWWHEKGATRRSRFSCVSTIPGDIHMAVNVVIAGCHCVRMRISRIMLRAGRDLRIGFDTGRRC